MYLPHSQAQLGDGTAGIRTQAVWLQGLGSLPVAFTDLPGASQPDGHMSWGKV